MKVLVAIAIGGALGTTALPHLPMPEGRDSPHLWLYREFTFREELWHPLQGYPRWSNPRGVRFE